MNIPILDLFDEIEYMWMVGDPIPTVGLWRRANDGTEFPVYQNTRGRKVWNSADVETSNIDEYEPTDAFWNAIGELVSGNGRVDVRGCEWYEREAIDSLGNILASADGDDVPDEVGELLGYADVQERGNDE